MLTFMESRFDHARRFWPRAASNQGGGGAEVVPSREGLLCDFVRRSRLRIGATPICLVHTRAVTAATEQAGDASASRYVGEVLNASDSPLGPPAGCAGVPLVPSASDSELPCPALLRLSLVECLMRVVDAAQGGATVLRSVDCTPTYVHDADLEQMA